MRWSLRTPALAVFLTGSCVRHPRSPQAGVGLAIEAAKVRKTFRKMALKCHPDKSSHARASEAFQLLTEAFEALHDPALQQQHLEKVLQERAASAKSTVGAKRRWQQQAAKRAKRARKKAPKNSKW